jgi:hypothetical protein
LPRNETSPKAAIPKAGVTRFKFKNHGQVLNSSQDQKISEYAFNASCPPR